MSTFLWRFPLQDVLLTNVFFLRSFESKKRFRKTVNILKNKDTAFSGQMINKLSVWQDFFVHWYSLISVIKNWGWILYSLFDHNKLIHWYMMESAIQQKQPRPHIFNSHLFLQLRWTENKETPKRRRKVQIPFKRQIKGDQQEMRRERYWKRHNMWQKKEKT